MANYFWGKEKKKIWQYDASPPLSGTQSRFILSPDSLMIPRKKKKKQFRQLTLN